MLGRIVVALLAVGILGSPVSTGLASAGEVSSCPSKAPQAPGASTVRCVSASTTVLVERPGTPPRSVDLDLAVGDLDGDGAADFATMYIRESPTKATICSRDLSPREYRASFFDVFTEVSIEAPPSSISACSARVHWTVDTSPPSYEGSPGVTMDPSSTVGMAIKEQGVKSPASVSGSFGVGQTTVDISQGSKGSVKREFTGHVTLMK